MLEADGNFVFCEDFFLLQAEKDKIKANMALAGIKNIIPADEVIDAMGEIGSSLPSSLRETGSGGLASTPTARKITENLHSQRF